MYSKTKVVILKKNQLSETVLKTLPYDYAARCCIVPLSFIDGLLTIGITAKTNSEIVQDIAFTTQWEIASQTLSDTEFERTLQTVYGKHQQKKDSLGYFEVVEEKKEIDPQQLKKSLEDTTIIPLVNQMITNAIDDSVSDIHIESYDDLFRVRYRRDGVLQQVLQPSPDKKQAIISRIKIMAHLDIAEKRRPQDGRIRVKRGNHVIDIRVSTIPTDFGEKVVMRILDKSQLNLNLNMLGFEPNTLNMYHDIIQAPYGMVLVTGPTGSGKTTTLYATLSELNSPEVNIMTIEDPIEYNLVGINQSQVRSEIGYTFANALRSFLRQDPDIIMVGEIRDQETAEIGIRAALTGHLVFSTLHTNNAPDTLNRLIDMELEPFLISSSVKMVIAQRLLRTICTHCKEPIDSKDYEMELQRFRHSDEAIQLYKGSGCEHCYGTGYRGRSAIFEVMRITPVLADAIHRKASVQELRTIACQAGMQTLEENAYLKLLQGQTTIEEVIKEIEFSV